jgi:putative polyhydroxyalkanoic acid system protein
MIGLLKKCLGWLINPNQFRRRSVNMVTINVPHDLGRAEARRRFEVADKSFAHQRLPFGEGGMYDWHDDRLYYAENGIQGYVDFLDDCLTIHAEIPDSPLYREEAIEAAIRQKAERVLNVTSTSPELPHE